MSSRDYYAVLGVPRNESPQGIRSAFHDLALRHHPDRAGPEGTPAFRDVVEAYRVLSDPALRRDHDATLRRRARPERSAAPRPAAARGGLVARDPFHAPSSPRPSPGARIDRILHDLLGAGPARGERAEPLLCDVVLSRDEAMRGGVLPIRIPVVAPCPACHGARSVAGFRCRACDARGDVLDERIVPLEIPPRTRPGTVLETPLAPLGIAGLRLRARIGVRA
jgi:DnaJ-class molecular chaperone